MKGVFFSPFIYYDKLRQIRKVKSKTIDKDNSNNLSAKIKFELSKSDIMKHWVPNGSCFYIDDQKY